MTLDQPFVTTGIGSLPMADPDQAVGFVLDADLDVPFWPQLPKRSFRELMIPQYAEGLPCLRISDEDKRIWLDLTDADARANEIAVFYERYLEGDVELGAISPEHAAGWHRFLDVLKEDGQSYPYLKGHINCPMTMGLGLNDQDQRAVYYDGDLFDCVVKLLEMKARWQAERLKPYCEQVVMFLDEPSMAAFGTSAYLSISQEDVTRVVNEVARPLREAGMLVGLHCCGNTDWGMFLDSEIDILNFDAYQFTSALALYPDALKRFFDRGGILAWGLVSTGDDAGQASVEKLMALWRTGLDALVAKGLDREQLIRRTMLTPSCGAGSLDESVTGDVFRSLVDVQEALRDEFV